jgi:hypothetical protein
MDSILLSFSADRFLTGPGKDPRMYEALNARWSVVNREIAAAIDAMIDKQPSPEQIVDRAMASPGVDELCQAAGWLYLREVAECQLEARARLAKFTSWVASRKEAGRSIDASSCRICLRHAQTLGPYGLREAFGENYEKKPGREWFVYGPKSDGAVWIGHLPEDKREAVFARIKAGDVVDDDIPF